MCHKCKCKYKQKYKHAYNFKVSKVLVAEDEYQGENGNIIPAPVYKPHKMKKLQK